MPNDSLPTPVNNDSAARQAYPSGTISLGESTSLGSPQQRFACMDLPQVESRANLLGINRLCLHGS